MLASSETAGRPEPREAVAAPGALLAYALVVAVGAAAALIVVAQAYPPLRTIGIDRSSPGSELGMLIGAAFWIVFGFVGSVRSRAVAGGAVVTFHAPFLIAGTILGGPFVGALIGLISVTEPRELRRAPWYGSLGNHATAVLTTIAAGVIGVGAASVLSGADILPASDALHTLAVGAVVAVTFVAMNLLLVLPIIALRSGAEFASVLRRALGSLRVTLLAEISVGWLMAVTYLWVAWWAPLLCVVVILAVWDAHDRREALRHDAMTGLLNDEGMEPYLEEAVTEARREGRRHALLFIDLDQFGQLNKLHGEDVGDEVIVASARRLAVTVRSSDVVGRQNRAGDEFVVLLRDLPDDEMAHQLALRVHAVLLRPIRVRGALLEVSVGASIGIAILAPGVLESVAQLKRMADSRMQQVKRAGGGVLGPTVD
ncbi:MAG: diguanylate cyclase [Chloroflexota bacterium]|nr:diguanylate cyclase [Chloroflexota bacterium]